MSVFDHQPREDNRNDEMATLGKEFGLEERQRRYQELLD